MTSKTKNTLSISFDNQDPKTLELVAKIKTLCEEYEVSNHGNTSLKATLEFDLTDCDAIKEFEAMLSANKVYQVLYRLREEVFRPARKHGYSDDDINLLIENSGGHDSLEINKETKFVSKDVLDKNPDDYYSNGEALISLLEKKYSKILEEENVDEDLCL